MGRWDDGTKIVSVFFGSATLPAIATVGVGATSTSSPFGGELAAVGDVDGDGCADVAIGASSTGALCFGTSATGATHVCAHTATSAGLTLGAFTFAPATTSYFGVLLGADVRCAAWRASHPVRRRKLPSVTRRLSQEGLS